jgi:hypothetical protein
LHVPAAHTVDLLDESLDQSFLADAGRLAAELRLLAPGAMVVVDEVQRLPPLLNEVSLPVVWMAPDRADALRAYAQLYLKEEIQAEALVRYLPGFARFLPIAALFHGQVLNVAEWLATLASRDKPCRDTCRSSRTPCSPSRCLPTRRGCAFKSASTRSSTGWIQHGRTSVALEVKASRQFSDRGLRGLRAIAALPGVRRRIVVYLGERRMRTADGIDVLPLRDFLHQVEQGRLF